MFGLFKKPDTRESTDMAISYLNSLAPDIKASVVEKIEKFLGLVATRELQQKDAFPTAMQAKQNCMRRLNLQDHRHPEYAMFQFIEDAYLSLYSHEKLASGKYSADKFLDFMITNTTESRKAMILLSSSGFDPINLA
jgi:hypothetical protein